MGKKIILATIGSLGDVHPFIALGLALKARGHTPVLAVPASFEDKARRAGLEAHPIFPDFRTIGEMLGMDEEAATRRMFRDVDFLIRRLLLHYLAESTRTLDALCEGASGIVSTMFALASPIVADRRGIPLIRAALQPMTLLSPHDPPQTPEFWMMAKPPVGPAKLAWNRMELALIRVEIRRRYAAKVNAVRRGLGLPPSSAPPIFQAPPADRLTLCLYSETLAPRPPDFPGSTKITGFPVFDSDTGAPETLAPDLEAFLSAGEPPIVFTLGTFAVYAAGDFYQTSAALAARLGRRAVLLTGPGKRPPPTPGIFVASYAPHSLLFPRASLVVHHGGIGTTGQVMRAGKPHLIVPHMGDQYDHGARITRLGLGSMLTANRYASEGEAALRQPLANQAMKARALEIATKIRTENGAEAAARAIELALEP